MDNHDRASRMADSRTRPDSEPRRTQQPSREFSEALQLEMLLTSRTLGTDLDEMMIVGYSEALRDLPIEILKAAFKRVRKECTFHAMPTPGEIRILAQSENERISFSRPRLPEPEPPPMTAEEKAESLARFDEVRRKLQPISKAKSIS